MIGKSPPHPRALMRALGTTIVLAGMLTVGLASATPAHAQAPEPAAASAPVRYDDLPDAPEGVGSYVFNGKWLSTSLTYAFVNETLDIAGTAAERQAVRDALAIWARVTPLSFTETSTATAQILISFVTGDHGDGYPFDGAYGVLAHAFFPYPPGTTHPLAGDVHFDDAETWTVNTRPANSPQPIDLVTVAAHEIGHSLGLDHSADPNALMAPVYNGSHRYLGADDIAGIKAQYGVTPGLYGWVWNSNASASSTPPADFSYNSSGGANTIVRTGVGVYRVAFPGLGGSNGNVQVSAYGAARRCKVVSWLPAGTTQNVNVRCFTLAGALADAQFVAQFHHLGPNGAAQGAYLLANQPATASYTPSTPYNHNSTGALNTVTRNGVGNYTATLPGFTAAGGNVHVTAHGSGSQYCKVQGWTATTVNVRCFTAAGVAANAAFTLQYTHLHVANGGLQGAYGRANNATSTAAYTLTPAYQWHSKGATVTGRKVSTGTYQITFPNLIASNKTSPLVTAYGSGNQSCTVASWAASGANTIATVQCYTPAGALVDTQFTVSYLTNEL